MNLLSVRVRYFRNIIDSGEVAIDATVTCLVGKNESGKTAFLQALHRLNPALDDVEFSIPDQYPAWLEKRDRLGGKDLEAEVPVSAVMALTEAETKSLEAKFGKGSLLNPERFKLERRYDGQLVVGLQISEEAVVRHIVASVNWAHGTKTPANAAKNVAELRAHCQALAADEANPERVGSGNECQAKISELLGKAQTVWNAIWSEASSFTPRFLYFSDYSKLPYTVPIKRVLTTQAKDLDEGERTARALLHMAAADDEYLQNPDYERRKRELENVANAITADVLKYWTQNPQLRVQPDITQRTESHPNGQQSVIDELKIRIWDDRHFLSLPFSEHSAGFQWFFSFLAAFSEYEFSKDSVVLLLDEPALGLHARAQADFLRFIDERLGSKRQVLYTTHSPFMIQMGNLDRVRMVEDKGQDTGAVVSTDVTSTDPDTLFPLQGALGYDLVQSLFIAPHNLVVEGTSDFTYLTVVSDHLKALGRQHLDPRWSVVPVGGVDIVPTFVALLGNHLDVTVVVDGKKGQHQKLNRLADAGILDAARLITVGEIIGTAADVEDLFTIQDYLSIFNSAMGTTFVEADLAGQDPIVKRLARLLNVERFDHGLPADYLLRNRPAVLGDLKEETLARFEQLFTRVNATLAH